VAEERKMEDCVGKQAIDSNSLRSLVLGDPIVANTRRSNQQISSTTTSTCINYIKRVQRATPTETILMIIVIIMMCFLIIIIIQIRARLYELLNLCVLVICILVLDTSSAI
jgi:hypothetical protein